MGFINDLEAWEAFEQDMQKVLLERFAVSFSKNSDKKWVDLVHPLVTAEVKFDRKMQETGNLFIEIGYKGADSGLFKDDNADLYIHWDKSFAYVFKVSKLRKDILEGVEDGKFRTIKWGDGYNSTWVLLPVCSAEDLAHAKIEF